MGFMDKVKGTASSALKTANTVKDKAVKTVDEKAPQIKEGIGRAGDFVDKKTKGKYSDKVDKGQNLAEDAVDKVAASNDAAEPTVGESAGEDSGERG